jgi:flavin reductase (DIM6/NTAB) family NADH-FMN oxidoreductase RutF
VVDRLSAEAERTLDALLGSLDYPMFVVTTVASDDHELSGCLVGFATQCSIRPTRFLVCISLVNHTARVAARADHLAVHLIPRDQAAIASLFGERTGDMVDKFSSCEWDAGPGGVPELRACPDRFVGRIVERVPLGDHTGYVLAPERADGRAQSEGDYVRFQDVEDLPPGHPA